ncbi:MAG: type II toxin-antitoxin system Phd/YefM family antitoxin [Deltaproteobacteria bacterium]|nr:type II toxin-antitoxin system Phd/YefM family antitoxin [Deltaproteobacteria bacterium]
MTDKFNVHEAKTHFSRLLSRVEKGEEIIIANAGKPVARLIPFEKPAKRIPGSAKGKIQIAKNFNTPLPESLLNLFEQ